MLVNLDKQQIYVRDCCYIIFFEFLALYPNIIFQRFSSSKFELSKNYQLASNLANKSFNLNNASQQSFSNILSQHYFSKILIFEIQPSKLILSQYHFRSKRDIKLLFTILFILFFMILFVMIQLRIKKNVLSSIIA